MITLVIINIPSKPKNVRFKNRTLVTTELMLHSLYIAVFLYVRHEKSNWV
jgi:hypothetical protein